MGVYGCLYQINFQELEQVLIPKMKNGSILKSELIEKHNFFFKKHENILIENAKYLDPDFQNIKN